MTRTQIAADKTKKSCDLTNKCVDIDFKLSQSKVRMDTSMIKGHLGDELLKQQQVL